MASTGSRFRPLMRDAMYVPFSETRTDEKGYPTLGTSRCILYSTHLLFRLDNRFLNASRSPYLCELMLANFQSRLSTLTIPPRCSSTPTLVNLPPSIQTGRCSDSLLPPESRFTYYETDHCSRRRSGDASTA